MREIEEAEFLINIWGKAMSEVVRKGDDGRRTNLELVYEAIRDLHAQEQVATRETIQEVSGLSLTVIDDRISCLIDRGRIHRVQRGVFVPTPDHPPARVISKHLMPDGSVSIEIGDDYAIVLTPRENRMLAELMAGAGQQFAAIELGHQATHIASELAARQRKIERELAEIRSAVAAPKRRRKVASPTL